MDDRENLECGASRTAFQTLQHPDAKLGDDISNHLNACFGN
jgi:hypothetical protein